jgi:transposase
VPSYCPHLNPIERLWKVMHENVTHNKTYPTFRVFAYAVLGFLRKNRAAAVRRVLVDHHRQFPRHRPEGFSDPRVTPL